MNSPCRFKMTREILLFLFRIDIDEDLLREHFPSSSVHLRTLPQEKASLGGHMVQLDRNELRKIFFLFDRDHSGGIDIDELTSAVSVLGIAHMTKQKIAQMFAEADTDGSGEIDFDEFVEVVEKGDGGQLAMIVQKLAEDDSLRDIVKQKNRPTEGRAAVLSEQLARVHEERMWMNKLSLLTVADTVAAAKNGYVNDRSIFVNANTGSFFTSSMCPPSLSPRKADNATPRSGGSVPARRPPPSAQGDQWLASDLQQELHDEQVAAAQQQHFRQQPTCESPDTIAVPLPPPSQSSSPRGKGLRRIFGPPKDVHGEARGSPFSPRGAPSPFSPRGSPSPTEHLGAAHKSPPNFRSVPAAAHAHSQAYHSPRPGLPPLAPGGHISPRTMRASPSPGLTPRNEPRAETTASPRRLALPAVGGGRSLSQPMRRPPPNFHEAGIEPVFAR